jgi:uncharacterized membrane protein
VTQKAIVAMAKLKGNCSDSAALKAVQSVEKKLVLLTIAKLVGKIAVACLVIYLTLTFSPLLPIGILAGTIIKVVTLMPISIKTFILVFQTLALAADWNFSNQGVKGLNTLLELEKKGAA